MAAFARLRGVGLWTIGSTVTSAELETIDSRWPKIINAADGSTHAPSTPIIIGGSGLQVTGDFEAPSIQILSVVSGGITTFEDGSDVVVEGTTGSFTFNNTRSLDFWDTSECNFRESSDLVLMDSSTLSLEETSIMSMADTASLVMGSTATMSLGGQVTVPTTGDILLEGSAQIVGPSTAFQLHSGGIYVDDGKELEVAGHLELLGNDAGIMYRHGTVDDADQDVTVAKDIWKCRKANTANRTITVRHTGSPTIYEGARMRLDRGNSTGFDYFIQREDTTLIATLPNDGTTQKSFVDLVYYAARGGWVVCGTSGSAICHDLGGTYD